VEGVKGFRCGLTTPKVQPIHSEAICHVLLHDDRPMLCNVLVENLEYERVELERSPPHLFLYPFLFNKENKTNKGSTSLNTREPKFYCYYYLLFIIIIFIYIFYALKKIILLFILFHLFTQPFIF
jgi:hypothetical protein